MRLKAIPKLELTRELDGLHHTIDGVAEALNTVPSVVEKCKAAHIEASKKQAVLTYFAGLMSDFFAELEVWQNLPLADAQVAYNAYMQGLMPELPPKLKARFQQRAETYAEALFEVMAEVETQQQQGEHHTSFTTLIAQLEQVVLQTAKLPEEMQSPVIALAYGDYHQALVAGVQAGFVSEEAAGYMADSLKQQMLLAAIKQAIRTSRQPLLLALEIADGNTGDADIDTLPTSERLQFLEDFIKEKEAPDATS